MYQISVSPRSSSSIREWLGSERHGESACVPVWFLSSDWYDCPCEILWISLGAVAKICQMWLRQECEAICRQAGAVKRSADQRVGDIKTRKELQCFGAAVIYGEWFQALQALWKRWLNETAILAITVRVLKGGSVWSCFQSTPYTCRDTCAMAIAATHIETLTSWSWRVTYPSQACLVKKNHSERDWLSQEKLKYLK